MVQFKLIANNYFNKSEKVGCWKDLCHAMTDFPNRL